MVQHFAVEGNVIFGGGLPKVMLLAAPQGATDIDKQRDTSKWATDTLIDTPIL